MSIIIIKDHFVGKSCDSAVDSGMLFTNKRGQIKQAAFSSQGLPQEWVSIYGSITISQSGKGFPVWGINETGLAVDRECFSTVMADQESFSAPVLDQENFPTAKGPENPAKLEAGSLEKAQYLLDTCGSVAQALEALERFAAAGSPWPVRYVLADSERNVASAEFLKGEKRIFRSTADQACVFENSEHRQEETLTCCRWAEDMFDNLAEKEKSDTVWSSVYDLSRRKLYLKRPADRKPLAIDLDEIDFSPGGRDQMLNIKEEGTCFQPYGEEANLALIREFLSHPAIGKNTESSDREAMISLLAEQSKNCDRDNAVVVRFLCGERVKQIPVKGAHKLIVLKYLSSKFEIGKDYTESQVNAIIDDWHTFGDYFVLRRELIDSGLMKRLPNGSKYWREIL